MKNCFIPEFNATLFLLTGLSGERFKKYLREQIVTISRRGDQEKGYWQEEIEKIMHYSQEEAIRELIKAKKIREKIGQIDSYLRGLQV